LNSNGNIPVSNLPMIVDIELDSAPNVRPVSMMYVLVSTAGRNSQPLTRFYNIDAPDYRSDRNLYLF
jgi:hypothetical protein